MQSLGEDILAWAEPFLDVTGGLTEEDARVAIEVAVEIWNAMVLDARQGGERHLDALRQTVEDGGWPPPHIFEGFVVRRRKEFASDLRLVDHFAVRTIDGKLAFHIAGKACDEPHSRH